VTFTTGQAWVDRYLDPTMTYVSDNVDVDDLVENHRELFDRYMAFLIGTLT
jgi:hypothetical protein